jgi:hypothetical protein
VISYAISAGMCASAGICHLALGVKRPVRAAQLAFAVMMGFICVFQLVLGALNTATSIDAAILSARWAVALAIAFMTTYGVFVRLYTGVAVPRVVLLAFFAVNAALLVYDLVAPSGLMFSAAAATADTSDRSGASGAFTRSPFGLVHLAWQAFNAVIVSWGVMAGWQMARHGRRRQGGVLVFGTLAFGATVVIDLFRNVLEREWPYVGGFGVMAMALVLAGQLALDFRTNEILLARMHDRAMEVRDQLNTPLQTLRFELEVTAAQGSLDPARIDRLQRAVARLTELGQKLQR